MTRALVLNALSTKTIKFMLVSFAFFVLFAATMPSPARAAALTDTQIQAVVSLLQSFGADQGAITNVEHSLRGKSGSSDSESSTTPDDKGHKEVPPGLEKNNFSGNSACGFLMRNLKRGATGDDVKKLQEHLKEEGDFSDDTTGYFGLKTEEALKRLQARQNIVASGDADTSGYGALGPKTRNILMTRCKSVLDQKMDGKHGTTTSNGEKPTCTLTASKSEIASAESVVLTWSSTNAQYASKRGGGIGSAEGSITLQPMKSMAYVKTVYGKGGSAKCTVDVKVIGSEVKDRTETVYNGSTVANQLAAAVGNSVFAVLSTPGELLAQLFKPRNNIEQQEKMYRELKQRNMERAMASSTKPMKPKMASSTEAHKGQKEVPQGLEKNNFPGASACAFMVRNLKRGVSGDDVKQFQEYLQTTGDLKEKASGSFDATTEEALKKIQARYNIVSSGDATTTGYGAVGPRTRQILMAHCKALKERKEERKDEHKEERKENASSTKSSTNANAGAPTCTLTADKSEVASGDVVTLTWTSTNATHASMPRGQRGPANGSLEVTPLETATYQKRVFGPSGEGKCQVTVTVTGDTSAPEVKVVRESILDQMFNSVGQQLAAGVTAYFDFFGVRF